MQRTVWVDDHFWFGRFDSLGFVALVIQLGYELVERTDKAIKVGRQFTKLILIKCGHDVNDEFLATSRGIGMTFATRLGG